MKLLSTFVLSILISAFYNPFSLVRYREVNNRTFWIEPVRTTPVIFKNRIITVAWNVVEIFDKDTGELIKKLKISEPISKNPVILNSTAYFVSDKGNIYEYSSNDIFKIVDSVHDTPVGDPVLCSKSIFFQGTKNIYKFSPENKEKIETINLSAENNLYWGNLRPLCQKNKLYIVTTDALMILDPKKFVMLKKYDLFLNAKEITGKRFYGASFPILKHQNLLFISSPRKQFLFDVQKGSIVKKMNYNISSAWGTKKSITLGRLNGSVIAIDWKGKTLWEKKITGTDQMIAPVVKISSNLYATGDKKYLIIFSPVKDTILKYYTTSGVIGLINHFSDPTKKSVLFSFMSRGGNFYQIKFFISTR